MSVRNETSTLSNNSSLDLNGSSVFASSPPGCTGECTGLTYSWWMLLVVVSSAILLLTCVFPKLISRCLGGGINEPGADELHWENDDHGEPVWTNSRSIEAPVVKGNKPQNFSLETRSLSGHGYVQCSAYD